MSLMLLGACSEKPPPWALRDISGLLPALEFALYDGSGRVGTASDFAGEATLLYFGYTHCPDVCPATLAQLAGVLRRLDGAARRVRILFVSVDPARDTPAVLQAYAHAFGPQVVALSGTEAQLRQLTKRYRVTYGLGKPDAAGNYEVSHSSAVFVFDRHGEARLLATQDDSADSLVGDLRRLLAEDTARVP
jgi:protein SCO1/2